jgi:cardiolipin synthase
MRGTGESATGSSAILTVPNAVSLVRILLIPVYCGLILDEDTTQIGILVFGAVVATDWVDGLLARRTGQVSELGKVLDPVADRLAIAAGLIALIARGAFPLWAGILILVREVVVAAVGAWLMFGPSHVRLDVRFVGKVGTFSLMLAIPWVSWGTLGFWLGDMALVAGWIAFAAGIVEYYVAAAVYVGDARRASAAS